jgi:hypothetical protein
MPAQFPLVQTSVRVQALPSLHPVPLVLLGPSSQTPAPLEQLIRPSLQVFGLLVQEAPAVHETHICELLQTRLVPQLLPAALGELLRHVIVPLVQLVMPV